MSIKENVKRAKIDFDEVYEAGIEVGKTLGGTAEPTLQYKYITENGTYTPDEGYDGIGQVEVNVETYLQDKYITENGTYTADEGFDGLRQVEINVVTEPILQEKTATENGEYTPDEGYDGLSKVTVQVASSGGGDNSKLAKLISGEEVSLTAEDLEGATAVGQYAFAYSNLTDAEIPSGVTQIGRYAFVSCQRLANVTLPSNITDIQDYAFNSCHALQSITLPTSLVALGASTFASCNSLTSLVIPKGVTIINSYTFDQCRKLTHITMLGSIETFNGSGAFRYCDILECLDLTACTSVPTLSNKNAFTGIPTTCKIKVPAHLYESWKSATNWSTHASKLVAVPVIKIDDDVYEIEEGMTWGEWIVSEYAPEGKFIVYVDNIRVAENNNYVVELQSGSPATPDTVMNSGDEYYQSEP